MTYYYDYKLIERSFVVCERAQRGSEPWCRWHGSAQTAGVGVRHGESAMVEDLLKGFITCQRGLSKALPLRAQTGQSLRRKSRVM